MTVEMSPTSPVSIPHLPLKVILPENTENLPEALYPLHRLIEQHYCQLPWPKDKTAITVLTAVNGGRGDIVGSTRAIDVMLNISPKTTIDWVVAENYKGYDSIKFLNPRTTSSVNLRSPGSKVDKPADFVLTGPVRLMWGKDYIQNKVIFQQISGPIFGFTEIASDLDSHDYESLQVVLERPKKPDSTNTNYDKIHSFLFPKDKRGYPSMGLQAGSGVFLDPERIEAPKSRGDCCPSYLLHLQDESLRHDILQAMQTVNDKCSIPDYDKYSFNSGYAHHGESLAKFIDCVALHEKQKNVIIVLNHNGEFYHPTPEEFCETILSPDRISFLQMKGYDTIRFQSPQHSASFTTTSDAVTKGRELTVIVRFSFLPQDMKSLQLASERLLATGDNSAVEAFCARCKLYLYEDVSNAGTKWRFLQQQVDLAHTLSPTLGKLLALFGGDRRNPEFPLNKPLNTEQMQLVEELLSDPELSDATRRLCDQVVEYYSFDRVLEGAVKRAMWQHLKPELRQVEAEAMGVEFQEGIVAYIQNSDTPKRELTIPPLHILTQKIEGIVRDQSSVVGRITSM